MGEIRLGLTVPKAEARQAVLRAAEGWGAELRLPGDRWPLHPPAVAGRGAELEGDEDCWTLHLPVVAGLRRGVVSGQLEVAGEGEAASISFVPGESHYSLHWASVVVLLFSAAGALLVILWPFHPGLMRLAPLGALLALGGWFLVLSRLRNSGPEEFLKAVEMETQPE